MFICMYWNGFFLNDVWTFWLSVNTDMNSKRRKRINKRKVLTALLLFLSFRVGDYANYSVANLFDLVHSHSHGLKGA